MPDKTNPQEAGTTIKWTAAALDPDKDQVRYKFLLDGRQRTNWSYDPSWYWSTSSADIGSHTIEVTVKDGNHIADGDDFKDIDFTISPQQNRSPTPATDAINPVAILNQPPSIDDLTPVPNSPQSAGTTIVWTTDATDPDSDQIFYKYLLNGKSETNWSSNHAWTWKTSEENSGESQIEVQVQDGKHASPDKYDANRTTSFIINAPQSMLQVSTNQSKLAMDWINKGNDFFNKSFYDLAISASDEAILIDPNLVEAWYNKGRALDFQGKYDEAIKCYDEAIRLDPNNAELWYSKGVALDDKGGTSMNQDEYHMAWDEAIKAFDEAIRLDPNCAKAWQRKGTISMYTQGYDEAIKAFDEAIRLDPNDANSWDSKAIILIDMGKYDEAIKCCDEAIRLDPNDSNAWEDKGNIFRIQGKYDEAIKCIDEAIRLDPRDGVAWDLKSMILEELGRTAEANAAHAKYNELTGNTD